MAGLIETVKFQIIITYPDSSIIPPLNVDVPPPWGQKRNCKKLVNHTYIQYIVCKYIYK